MGSKNNGLVKIVLKQEKKLKKMKSLPSCILNQSMMMNNFSTGDTVLGESSSQTFDEVGPLKRTIESEICFRLVINNEIKNTNVVPLSTRDPTPPRIDTFPLSQPTRIPPPNVPTYIELDNLSSATTSLPYGQY